MARSARLHGGGEPRGPGPDDDDPSRLGRGSGRGSVNSLPVRGFCVQMIGVAAW